MVDKKIEDSRDGEVELSKVEYEAPSMVVIGKVTELTSGPVTVHNEGTGLGFHS